MIAYHFRLQAIRLHRMVRSMGLHPLLNYSLFLAMFVGASATLFTRDSRFPIAYSLIALLLLSMQSKPAYNDWLNQLYSRGDFCRIRLLENLLIAIPFILALVISQHIYFGMGLLLAAALMAINTKRRSWNIVLPTPFYRHPFEFTAGFRFSAILVLSGYYLVYISVYHANIGIGIFVIYSLGVLAALYHSYPEDPQYVWNFSCTAAKFLRYKLLTAWGYTLLLMLPALLALSLAYPNQIARLMGVCALGLAVATAGVLSKYTTFPHELSLKEGLPFGAALVFPPLLLFVLPYFYLRAHRQLGELLT